jgi:hypothetical protein
MWCSSPLLQVSRLPIPHYSKKPLSSGNDFPLYLRAFP